MCVGLLMIIDNIDIDIDVYRDIDRGIYMHAYIYI